MSSWKLVSVRRLLLHRYLVQNTNGFKPKIIKTQIRLFVSHCFSCSCWVTNNEKSCCCCYRFYWSRLEGGGVPKGHNGWPANLFYCQWGADWSAAATVRLATRTPLEPQSVRRPNTTFTIYKNWPVLITRRFINMSNKQSFAFMAAYNEEQWPPGATMLSLST